MIFLNYNLNGYQYLKPTSKINGGKITFVPLVKTHGIPPGWSAINQFNGARTYSLGGGIKFKNKKPTNNIKFIL